MTDFSFDYDNDYDILYVFDKSEKADFSIDFQDSFIVDFNDKKKVVGVEILDASEIIWMKKPDLKKIESVDMQTATKKDMILVKLSLKSKKETVQASLPIPVYAK